MINDPTKEEWIKKLEEREFPYEEACRNAITYEQKIAALIPFIEQRVIHIHWESSELNDLIAYTCMRMKMKAFPHDLYPIALDILDNINKYEFPRLEIYKGSFNDGLPMFKTKEEYRRRFCDGEEVFDDN